MRTTTRQDLKRNTTKHMIVKPVNLQDKGNIESFKRRKHTSHLKMKSHQNKS